MEQTREIIMGEEKETEIRIVPDACRDWSLQEVPWQGQHGQPGKVPKSRRDGSSDAIVVQR